MKTRPIFERPTVSLSRIMIPTFSFRRVTVFGFGFAVILMTANLRAELVFDSIAGETHVAQGFTNFNSSTVEMVDMRVEVFWANGTSDTALWTSTGISRSDWSMTQGPGSTFSNPFTLTNQSRQRMTRFVMHGAGSTTVFDRSVTNSTTGTANGRDLQEYSSYRFFQTINVDYFDQVRLADQAPVGDVFAGMSVSFSRGINRRGGQFVFRTDTDTAISQISMLVPEPSTFALCFSALIWIGSRRNRKP